MKKKYLLAISFMTLLFFSMEAISFRDLGKKVDKAVENAKHHVKEKAKDVMKEVKRKEKEKRQR